MSSQHLADKPLKLATCPRCGAYVLAGQLSGLRVAVEPVPASMEAYRAALLDSRKGYRLIDHSCKPHALAEIMRGRPLDEQKIMLEHPCAVRSARPVVYQEVVSGPPLAPVTRGERRGGHRQPPAPGSASQTPTGALGAVRPASHPRSRVDHDKKWLYRRCERCGEHMGYEEAFGVMYRDMWVYVWHDPCPTEEVRDG